MDELGRAGCEQGAAQTASGSPKALTTLVAKLGELYQPIFGHPEFSVRAARASQDRLTHVRRAAAALSAQLGRPLRVLDLGSAQGFISLTLAQDGARVKGIDYDAANVAVAQALADSNSTLKVNFEHARVEQTLETLHPGQFDLVLGLSVFHHVVYEQGADRVKDLLTALAPKVSAIIVELALASEPMYWAKALPDDEQELLSGFDFVHELKRCGTHLSDVARPLVFASQTFWYFGGDCTPFSSFKAKSHSLAGEVHQGTRHYYFSHDQIAKRFRIRGSLAKVNTDEIVREAHALRTATSIETPSLIESGRSNHEAWLVRTFIPGQLLIELIQEGSDYDSERIIRDVLAELVAYERDGLYHNDVSVWNVLVKPDGGARLIDFGALSPERINCDWPRDLFLAFCLFVENVLHRRVPRLFPVRHPLLSPFALTGRYRRWAMQIWLSDSADWTFAFLLAQLDTDFSKTPITFPWPQAYLGKLEIELDQLGDRAARHKGGKRAAVKAAQQILRDCQTFTERLDASVADIHSSMLQACGERWRDAMHSYVAQLAAFASTVITKGAQTSVNSFSHSAAGTGMLYLDVTDIVHFFSQSKEVSGIQRVVCEVATQILLSANESRVQLVAFSDQAGGYVQVDRSILTKAQRPSAGKLRKMSASLNLPLPRKRAGLLRTIKRMPEIAMRRLIAQLRGQHVKHVAVANHDHFLVMGAVWDYGKLHDYLTGLRMRGVRVTQIIYDLIPHRSPQYCPAAHVTRFRSWLCKTIDYASQYITISEYVRRDLVSYLVEQGAAIPATSIPLAHEFTDGLLAPQLDKFAIIHGRPFAVCVGTIDARKNQLAVLQVWQELVRRHPLDSPALVLAGRWGWRHEPILRFLESTGYLGGRVQVVSDASDGEIGWLYDNALFSVFASNEEGWGLPVGEAAWRGTPTIIARSSSLGEILPDGLADTFAPGDLKEMYEIIEGYALDPRVRCAARAKLAGAKLRSWKDVGSNYLSVLCDQKVAEKSKQVARAA